MIVMKFGGSSVRDAERIKHVVDIIKSVLKQKPIVVFSAMGDTTDRLLAAGRAALNGDVNIEHVKSLHVDTAKDLGVKIDAVEALLVDLEKLLNGIALIKELSDQTLDYLVSFGERLSVRVIAGYLESQGIPAKFYDAWDIGFRTDSNFKDAQLEEQTYENVRQSLQSLESAYSYTPIVTGFIAWDRNKKITTLGRGGSDLTAAVIGASIGAEEIQVWKDVDGILTTDPRLVKEARPVSDISFEEAAELAYFGAKVLHPLSMRPAMIYNIPVRVKNSYKPEHPGTLITSKSIPSTTLVKAITCKRRITMVDITSSQMLGQHGFLAELFQVFSSHKISVDVVATSEVSVSLTLNKGMELGDTVKDLEHIAKVEISHNKALISLISDISKSSEIISRAFKALHQLNVNVQMISQGASKVNISFVVDDSEVESCIRAIHSEFFGN